MKLRREARAVCALCGLLTISSTARAQQSPTAVSRLQTITADVNAAAALAASGRTADAQNAILRAYLDEYEPLEALYGSGSASSDSRLAAEIGAAEASFHAVMRTADPKALAPGIAALSQQLTRVRQVLPADENARAVVGTAVTRTRLVDPALAATPEIRAVLQQLQQAALAYRQADGAHALALVEHSYLEGFEPLESRLPRALVERIEKTIHLQLRPAIRNHADIATVNTLFGSLGQDLISADHFMSKGGSVWFAVVNSFVIVVREGLEAVLLIAALLAYLAAIGAERKHRRQIYTGMAAGVVASVATWFVAATLIPISGANRELLEGLTALSAVAVLLYVGHWLFQKTYIHDWKDYLRTRMGGAVTRGSAFAMAMLAFAAVYREGFETVLFYQALAFDSGVAAILAGFIPGALVITLVGFGIIRAGVKLPLKKVFAGTNALLMYLAFVFIGKGIYNLQEAGVLTPHPLPLPDHPALRQLLGFYPLIETLAAQLAFLVLLTTTYLLYRRTLIKRAGALQSPAQEPKRVVA